MGYKARVQGHTHNNLIIISLFWIFILMQDAGQARAAYEAESNLEDTQVQTFINQDVLKNKTYNAIESERDVNSEDLFYLELTDFEYEEIKNGFLSEFGNTGFELCIKSNGELRLNALQEKEISSQSGLLVGDVITSINGKKLNELTKSEVEELVFLAPGHALELTVKRFSVSFNVVLKLAYAPKETVSSQWIQPAMAYIRVSRFLEHTADEFNKTLQRLERNAYSGINAYVIDLRGNPGGNLKAAVDSAEIFLHQGVIAYTENHQGQIQSLYTAHKNSYDIELGKKVIVLIDQQTASAAELFTAALQDNARALIVGRKSYGKATVQDFIKLENGGAIKLTTAKYMTPSGRTVHKKGILPDILVESPSSFMSIAKTLTFTESNKLVNCDHKSFLSDVNDKDISVAVEIMRSPLPPLNYRAK